MSKKGIYEGTYQISFLVWCRLVRQEETMGRKPLLGGCNVDSPTNPSTSAYKYMRRQSTEEAQAESKAHAANKPEPTQKSSTAAAEDVPNANEVLNWKGRRRRGVGGSIDERRSTRGAASRRSGGRAPRRRWCWLRSKLCDGPTAATGALQGAAYVFAATC